MMDSKRITELNQRSAQLTDAELSIAQKFSVLLPMSDLPEIVITGEPENVSNSSSQADVDQETVATIPFQSKENNEAESQVMDRDDSSIEQEHVSDDLLASVEMPKDELSISKETSHVHASDGETAQAEADDVESNDESEEGDFRIEEVGQYSDRVEKIAKNIETMYSQNTSSLIALTSVSELTDQDTVFNSLLVSIARRNPTLRLVAIQNSKPSLDTHPVSIGIGHVLSEEYLLEDVVIPTTVENLDYLAYSESELSGTAFRNQFSSIADELKKHYDIIFVNCGSPYDNHSQTAAEIADLAYLMVSLQACEKESMEQTADGLRKSGVRLAGCIVTEYQRDAS